MSRAFGDVSAQTFPKITEAGARALQVPRRIFTGRVFPIGGVLGVEGRVPFLEQPFREQVRQAVEDPARVITSEGGSPRFIVRR